MTARDAVPDHKMRRARQELSKEECTRILSRGSSGVLALVDATGFPYAVPLSYVFAESSLFFHSARCGHKLEAVASCDRASFCVVDQDLVVPERFTTYFRSAIVFGHIRVVGDGATRRRALELLGRKYSPGIEDALETEIDGSFERTCVLELTAERVSGKEAIELVDRRQD